LIEEGFLPKDPE